MSARGLSWIVGANTHHGKSSTLTTAQSTAALRRNWFELEPDSDTFAHRADRRRRGRTLRLDHLRQRECRPLAHPPLCRRHSRRRARHLLLAPRPTLSRVPLPFGTLG